jgi:hypothetical protein
VWEKYEQKFAKDHQDQTPKPRLVTEKSHYYIYPTPCAQPCGGREIATSTAMKIFLIKT